MVTSKYSKNLEIYRTLSISGDRGKQVGYQGEYFKELAPKLSFWQVWHSNIGLIAEEENNHYYIKEYWIQVLSKLDPQEIYDKFRYDILLCYEPSNEFCHRHIVAAWFELFLDIEVPEIDSETMQKVPRPEYIKEILEEEIKKTYNMHKFNSIRAAYIFEKSEKKEAMAEKLEKTYVEYCFDDLHQEACNLRCEADEAEAEYNMLHGQKKLTRK